MINKFIAKKWNNPSGVKPGLQQQLDAETTPGSQGAKTVLENNPDFHLARL